MSEHHGHHSIARHLAIHVLIHAVCHAWTHRRPRALARHRPALLVLAAIVAVSFAVALVTDPGEPTGVVIPAPSTITTSSAPAPTTAVTPDVGRLVHDQADGPVAAPRTVQGGRTAGPRVEEDDPRWDCRTDGNRRCGLDA